MENEALKDYEVGEWILFAHGNWNMGIGEVSSIEVRGSKPGDVTLHLIQRTGPCYIPTADEILCNISKKGVEEALQIWRNRAQRLEDSLYKRVEQFTVEALNIRDRPFNYTLRESWKDTLDNFIDISADMVNVYNQLEGLRK